MSLWPNQQPNLICFYNFLRKLELLLYGCCLSVHHNRSISWIDQQCKLIVSAPFCPWCYGGQRVGSCGWQEAETVVPTMGCQDSVSRPNSSSTQAGQSLFTVTSEKTSDGGRQRGGMEEQGGPHPGLDWIALDAQIRRQERADWGKGSRGKLAGATVTPRKSSLIPQITCHTCGGQDSLSHTMQSARSWEWITEASDWSEPMQGTIDCAGGFTCFDHRTTDSRLLLINFGVEQQTITTHKDT